jgi:threonine dehydrogenase-like Zn-dependent dehydrogenase
MATATTAFARDNRALVRVGTDMRISRMEHPANSPGKRILRVGICGTDLQIQRGSRADRASVLGHEGIAVTDGVGQDRCEIFNPVDPDDQDAVLGHSYDGLLRDYLVDDRPHVVAAHPRLPVDLGPLVEPAATALYAWELMRPALFPGASVTVFGGGSAALLVAMIGEGCGYRIQIVHPRSNRLRFIESLGVLDRAELTHTARPDSANGAIACLPREAAGYVLHESARCLAEDGVVDLFGGIPAGLHHQAWPEVDLAAVRRLNVCGRNNGVARTSAVTDRGKQVWLTGHRGTSPMHLHQAQLLLVAAVVQYGKLITEVISLDEARHRVPVMARRDRSRPEHVKVVVDMTSDLPTRPADLDTTVEDLLRDSQ